ncbi:DNA-directed RNA polymerase III subunit RPC5 [Euwallacea similis]|uniref:DNA-directed RNA polymerase III subunit RPC5 n=1 Tax=Euwallacea similis TaxID=1736056 RepID=UPI00344E03BF
MDGETAGSPIGDVSEDDVDPVIREIPIINSKKLEDILYLLQFPFKGRNIQNNEKINKCSFKPGNKEIMLEMGINTESTNFDAGRAELIAHETDGDLSSKKDLKSVYFENEIVDKVFLKSTRCVKDTNNYAVAAFNGREIHLTAIKDVFQLKPYFPYLDKSLKRGKDVLNMANNAEDGEKAGPSTAQQVTVRFKQTQDLPDKKAGLQNVSYHELQARRNQEPFVECRWYNEDSSHSNVERLKLISDIPEETGQAENMPKEEYMTLLVPEDKEQAPLEPTLPSHVLSLHALRDLPLSQQCKLLLKDAQIIQFHQIMLLLAGVEGITADSLIKSLTKVAVLVRGNWVVKSEVLYPEETFSAISGVPAELMCRARDYIMYLFTKQQYVQRIKVSSLVKIPAEEVKEIFAGISKLQTHDKGWELALPTDHDFLAKHGDLVQRQNLFWEHRYNQLSHFLTQPSRQRRKSKSVSESEGAGGKTRTSSISCSDNESGTVISPLLSRKKARHDSCGSSNAFTNNAALTDE